MSFTRSECRQRLAFALWLLLGCAVASPASAGEVAATIERIVVAGNLRTAEHVIRRELRLHEGDALDEGELERGRERVQALGLFETVALETRPGTAPGTEVVHLSVRERATRSALLGIASRSAEPLGLLPWIVDDGMFGRGSSLALVGELTQIRRILAIRYAEPSIHDSPVSIALELHDALIIHGSLYDSQADGGLATLGAPLSDHLRLLATWSLEDARTVPVSGQTILLANRFRGGRTSSLEAALQWDTLDDRRLPTRGVFVAGAAEIASPLLGSETEFQRFRGAASGFLPFGAHVIGSLHVNAGYIRSPAERPVATTELFFEGGGRYQRLGRRGRSGLTIGEPWAVASERPFSVDGDAHVLRGFADDSVSPSVLAGLVPGAPLASVPIGGTKELLVNAEVEWLPRSSVRVVGFVDAGNVYSEAQPFLDSTVPGLRGLLFSTGLRVDVKLRPVFLSLECAAPLTPRPGDSPVRIDAMLAGGWF